MERKRTMQIDDVREYWDERPCNVRHGEADIEVDPILYTKQVTQRKYFVEPHIEKLAGFPWWDKKRVLDMGCGIGSDSIAFAVWGAKVTAMDVSGESIRIAQKRVAAFKPQLKIQFLRCDIEEACQGFLARRKGYYDLVYSFGVIHHTPNPEKAVRTARYFVSDDGVFKLMLYHRKSTKVLRILLTNLGKLLQRKSIDEIVAMESEAQTGCPITYTYTKDSARKLLEDNGFIVESIDVEHIFPYRVEDYREYRYKRAFPWNIIKGTLFRWLEHRVGWHLCITAKPIGD